MTRAERTVALATAFLDVARRDDLMRLSSADADLLADVALAVLEDGAEPYSLSQSMARVRPGWTGGGV